MSVGRGFQRWMAIMAAVVMMIAAHGQRVDKSIAVVPKDGPLQGQTVYTGSFALFVGIGSYQNPQIPNIKSAPNDAKTIRNLLVEKYGFDPDPDHSVVLTDAQATKERITDEISRLCDHNRVKPTDRVLVFFSCHGQGVPLPDGSKLGYLIPYNATVDLRDVDNSRAYLTSCLDMEDVAKTLRSCPAKHRTLIVDSCFSGFAAGTKVLAGTTYGPDALKNMLSQAGLVVMTAGDSEEEAQAEASENGLSLFTRALFDSLNEGSINGGTFTALQLAGEAAAKTLDRSGAKQKPQFGQKDGSGQMLFFSSQPAPVPVPPKILSAILQVTSTPSGANVLIDGKVVGKTPLNLPIDLITETSKSVEVAVQLDGYLAAGQTVTLTRGATVAFSAPLVAVAAPTSTPIPRAGGRRVSAKGDVEMILIPEGEFTMGSNVNDTEKPQRKVFLDAYTIGKTPVTVGQFKAYCKDVGIDFGTFLAPSWGWKDDHPMVNVNWEQARAFCKWAGGDLPTEAQWEKAARGTEGREYPWGNDFDVNRLWCSKASYSDAGSTAPVGSFPSGASPYGCLDMAGNVCQWCLDWYAPSYSAQPDRNPTGPGFATQRVLRGGSWRDSEPQFFRSAYRLNYDPAYRSDDLGFRLAGPP